ncbi:MAG: hypothetical protein K2X77_16260 [Candidatus Obscuribacterales bacterium]|jgi:hypothetical protein|nr:hypothetical protein [Candidatus Obscuribacterales bacterium]
MDEKVFDQRLKETVAWCTRDPTLPECTEYVVSEPSVWSDTSVFPKFAKSADYLRTAALRPAFYRNEASLFFADFERATQEIEAISQKRTKLLTNQDGSLVENIVGMADGRLLAYVLGTSAHDGISAAITDYFDHDDSPPWDTWLCCVASNSGDYVLSWVPPAWIEDVEAVMHYEYMGTLVWVDTLVFRPEKFKFFDIQECSLPAWLSRYTIQ